MAGHLQESKKEKQRLKAHLKPRFLTTRESGLYGQITSPSIGEIGLVISL